MRINSLLLQWEMALTAFLQEPDLDRRKNLAVFIKNLDFGLTLLGV